MISISSNLVVCLPLVNSQDREQTKTSLCLRTLSIALGIIALISAILVLYGISGFTQIGVIGGWSLIAGGSSLLLAGSVIRGLKEKIKAEPPSSFSVEPPSSFSKASVEITPSHNNDQNSNPINLSNHFTPSPPQLNSVITGSQRYCSGSINQSECRSQLNILNSKAPMEIFFDSANVQNELDGGTCSAMSITFLKGFLKFLRAGNPIEKIIDYYKNNQKDFDESNIDYRTLQASMNCISIKNIQLSTDELEFKKTQALLAYYDIEIETSTDSINVHTLPSKELEVFLTSLHNGLYFVRGLERNNNEKKEKWGHSLILIKTEKIFYVYEPNTGLNVIYDISSLRMLIQKQHTSWTIPFFRLYKCKQ